MKRYLFTFFFIFLTFNSNAQDSLYFLDIDKLINNSNLGKKILLKLKKINDQNLSRFENYEKDLKKEDEEINKIKNILSKDELNTKVSELKKKISVYRNEKNQILKEYNQLKNNELDNFFTIVTPYIEEYMEINSIKFIIDKKNIFIANANYDISDKLIEFINLKLKND